MKRADVLQKIQEVVQDVLGASDITIGENTVASEVPDWDSINHVKIILEVENQFGLRFELADIESIENVGDLVSKTLERAS